MTHMSSLLPHFAIKQIFNFQVLFIPGEKKNSFFKDFELFAPVPIHHLKVSGQGELVSVFPAVILGEGNTLISKPGRTGLPNHG